MLLVAASNKPPLTWQQRMLIARDAAEGLRYLSEFASPPIIHRDVKSANILLDDNYEAQVWKRVMCLLKDG